MAQPDTGFDPENLQHSHTSMTWDDFEPGVKHLWWLMKEKKGKILHLPSDPGQGEKGKNKRNKKEKGNQPCHAGMAVPWVFRVESCILRHQM